MHAPLTWGRPGHRHSNRLRGLLQRQAKLQGEYNRLGLPEFFHHLRLGQAGLGYIQNFLTTRSSCYRRISPRLRFGYCFIDEMELE